MRPTPWTTLEPYRVAGEYGESCGAFIIAYRGLPLRCIVSDGLEWEHVSVSLKNRCPNWHELQHIKELFWNDEETVMQLHVPKNEHIDIYPNCLHLWRPIRLKIPLPPAIMV